MIKLVFLFLVVVFLFQPATAGDLQEVDQLIRNTVNAVLATIRNPDLNQEVKKERIMEIINPVFDLPLMAKLTLGREHWTKLKSEEREEFTDLFIKQMQNSYLRKVELAVDANIKFEEPSKENSKIYMTTLVLTDDKPIKLLYKLYRRNEKWRVYDVEIQDVSIVKSYGQQYNQILREGSFDDLKKKIKEKIDQNEKEASKQKGEK